MGRCLSGFFLTNARVFFEENARVKTFSCRSSFNGGTLKAIGIAL
jgi:hypothetical protein